MKRSFQLKRGLSHGSVRLVQRHEKSNQPEDPGEQSNAYQMLWGDTDAPQFYGFVAPDLEENGGDDGADKRQPAGAPLFVWSCSHYLTNLRLGCCLWQS